MDPTEATRRYYRTIALFYDLEIAHRDDLAFWRGLVRYWQPMRLAEIGCGSGRVVVPLARQIARHGGRAVGLDLSPELLQLAEERWGADRADAPETALRFVHGDMRWTACMDDADLVLFVDDPLTHLAAWSDLTATFATVRPQLRPGGRLVVEASLLPADVQAQARTVCRHCCQALPVPWGTLRVEQMRRIIPAEASADVWYRYTLQARPGERVPDALVDACRPGGIEARFSAHYLRPDELAALFDIAGCRVDERWGDFARHPLTDAGMAIFVGERR